jgi:hypothetical protein
MKAEEFVEGTHFYFDESGLMVMTQKYHLDRGFCCGNGCTHCPFNFENVDEKKRRELVLNRKNGKEKK